jgi:hypothetical protein
MILGQGTVFLLRVTYTTTPTITPCQFVGIRDAIFNTSFEAQWSYLKVKKGDTHEQWLKLQKLPSSLAPSKRPKIM